MFGPSYPRGDTTLSCPKRGGRYSRFASKTPSARQYRSMLRGRSSNQKRVALCALWHLVEPAAEEAVQGIASTYSFALNHHPLATKAVTSAAAYGLGDMMAQLKSSKRLDGVRVSNFVVGLTNDSVPPTVNSVSCGWSSVLQPH